MRAFQRALLLTCSVEGTLAFWQKVPLALSTDTTLSPSETARRLLRDGSTVPLSWACAAMNHLEWHLVERSVPVDRFLDAITLHGNRSSFVSSRVLLGLFSPMLAALFQLRDPHELFFRMLSVAGSQFFPDLIFQRLQFERLGRAQRRAVVLFGFRALWSGACSPWDGEIFSARLLRRMPVSLGLQEFTGFTPLADVRTPQAAIGGVADVCCREGKLFIDGEVFGKQISFEHFCHERGLDIADRGQPRTHVMVAERDYICPLRSRPVLTAGCAYNAPFYLFDARWELQRARLASVFQHFVNEVLTEVAAPELARVRDLERTLQDSLSAQSAISDADLTPQLVIRAFGRFSISRSTTDSPLALSNWRLLKTLAAAQGAAMSVAQVARELWPARPRSESRSALDTAVHRVRRQLGDHSLVVVESGWMHLDLSRVSIDTVALLDLRATIIQSVGKSDAQQLADWCERLLDIYRGPFCDGEDDSSVRAHRARFAEGFNRCVEMLVRRAYQLGLHAEARSWLERALERNEALALRRLGVELRLLPR